MSKIEDDFDEVMEYLVPVSKNEFQDRVNRKYKDIEKLIDRLDISQEVGKFYDCDAKSQSINGRHIGAPIGYQNLNRQLKKIGFSDYPEFLGYEEEERDEKIKDFVRYWIIFVNWDKYKELREELSSIDIKLSSYDSILKLGRDYKNKMKLLEKMEDELKEIHRNWEERVGESYEEMSEEEGEEVDECVERLLEKW